MDQGHSAHCIDGNTTEVKKRREVRPAYDDITDLSCGVGQ